MENFKDRPLHFAYAWPVKIPNAAKEYYRRTFSRGRALAMFGLLLLVGVSKAP